MHILWKYIRQGHEWDTPSDMLYALIGGCAALGLLSRAHDRQMSRP
jgi:putative membrane protein